MTKRYFTASWKERVRNLLLDRKFKPLHERDEQDRASLADRILLYQLSPQEWGQVAKLPEGWLPRVNSIAVRSSKGEYYNSNYSLDLTGSRVVPTNLYRKTFGEKDMTPELWGEWEALEPREDQLKAERRDLSRQVDATLATFRTVEAAVDGWPEAADIIAEVCGKGVPKTLPAVTTLNAALNLPPEEDSK